MVGMMFVYLVVSMSKKNEAQQDALENLKIENKGQSETLENMEGMVIKLINRWNQSDDKLDRKFDALTKEVNDLDNQISEVKGSLSRKWNSMMMGIKMQGKNGLFTPPTYSHIYNLKTVQMSNDKGTWFGWDVSKVGPVASKEDYEMAKGFATSVGKGEVQAKHGSEENESKQPYISDSSKRWCLFEVN